LSIIHKSPAGRNTKFGDAPSPHPPGGL